MRKSGRLSSERTNELAGVAGEEDKWEERRQGPKTKRGKAVRDEIVCTRIPG